MYMPIRFEEFEKPNTGHETENYDIINELGPKNRYDRLAGEAQIVGTQYKDRKLVDDGRDLAKLIIEIPWTSDKYYLIEAKAGAIESRIKAIKIEWAGAVETDMARSRYFSFSIVYKPETECWELFMGIGRTAGYIPNDEIHIEFLNKILDHFKLRGDITESKRNTSEVDGDMPFWREETTWTDSKGRIIYDKVYHSHDNMTDVGILEYFNFFESEDIDFALSVWNEIKVKVVKRDEVLNEKRKFFKMLEEKLESFAGKTIFCVVKGSYLTQYKMSGIKGSVEEPYLYMQGHEPWDSTYFLGLEIGEGKEPSLILNHFKNKKACDFNLEKWTSEGYFTFDENKAEKVLKQAKSGK